MCKDLDFDKTKDLGGYEIRTIVYTKNIDRNNPNLESVTGNYGTNSRYMLRVLNSSFKILVYTVYTHNNIAYCIFWKFRLWELRIEGWQCSVRWKLVVSCWRSRQVDSLSVKWYVNEYTLYLIRDDWPVEEKWNIVLSRLFEANIVEYVPLRGLKSFSSKLKYSEKEKNRQMFQVITLQKLAFAFAILGIGLAFSTVVFIVEVLIG